MWTVQIVLLCKYGNGIIGEASRYWGELGQNGGWDHSCTHHPSCSYRYCCTDNNDDGVGADADLEIVVVHVWGAVSG